LEGGFTPQLAAENTRCLRRGILSGNFQRVYAVNCLLPFLLRGSIAGKQFIVRG
jgi:hypothetical protein